MPILSSLADLHRLLDAFNELGVTVFCVICAALVLTEVLIPKFFKVLEGLPAREACVSFIKEGAAVDYWSADYGDIKFERGDRSRGLNLRALEMSRPQKEGT
jgi:hypothetical protein